MRPIPRKQLIAVNCVVSVVAYVHLAATAFAQFPNNSIPLTSTQTALSRLAPGGTAETEALLIGDCANITVDVAATHAGLRTSITAPGGQTLDPNTIAAFNGTFVRFGRDPNVDSLLPLLAQPGDHHLYIFPAIDLGTYTVHFEADPNLAEEVPVVTEVMTDSPVRVALISTRRLTPRGSSIVFSAAVFEGIEAVAGASVSLAIKHVETSGPETILTLHDDGVDGDHLANDGLYSGTLQTDVNMALGPYYAVATITGTSASATLSNVWRRRGSHSSMAERDSRGCPETQGGMMTPTDCSIA
jgi:hypothetical protein